MKEGVERRVQQLEARAASLASAKHWAAARRAAEEAIAVVENSSGPESPRLIPLFRLLAMIVSQPYGARNEGAAEHLLRALEIASAHDPDDPALRALYGQAGNALHVAGRLEEARGTQERALDIAVREVGDVRFELRGLALIVTDIHPEEAVPLWERLVQLEASLGGESISHVVALTQLGECLLQVGRTVEAAARLEDALQMLAKRTKGSPHRWASEIEELLRRARASDR